MLSVVMLCVIMLNVVAPFQVCMFPLALRLRRRKERGDVTATLLSYIRQGQKELTQTEYKLEPILARMEFVVLGAPRRSAG